MKKYVIPIICLFLAAALVIYCFTVLRNINNARQAVNRLEPHEEVAPAKQENKSASSTSSQSSSSGDTLPKSFSIDVPFTSQAPKANWDQLHEEACEEASLIMVRHFGDKEKIVSTDAADKEIVELVNFEESHGYKVDVTVNELNQIAKDFYGMNSGRVVIGFSIEDIKKEIAKGHPVIIPAAGKLLENPNFKNGGPNYHMLVITGYDQANFITNDPGTRKGYGYKYDFDLLFSAIHDWNSENISNGAKSYLVFD